MKKIQFQYSKTPTEVTLRKAIVLSKPTKNYFTIDTTELNEEEMEELNAGLATLQSDIDDAFAKRTKWLQEHGFGSYFRNFNPDKMNMAV